MRILDASLIIAGLLAAAIHANSADAAIPEVALSTDPRTNLHCPAYVMDALTVSGATISTGPITEKIPYFYEAAFNALTWTGSLKKYPLVLDQHNTAIKRSTVVWDAADILTGDIKADERRIYTARNGSDQSLAIVPFMWHQLSAEQQELLNTSPITGANDQLGENRLNYLRGQRNREVGQPGGIFRPRRRLLGDIVNSSPVFSGLPSSGLQENGYQAFYNARKGRRPAIFIGANDGMLHAFDAINGEELFAYIPLPLFAKLAALTQSEYGHQSYVDGSITVAEARVGNQWRTVLAAGMGGGAQGVFALDVSDPENFDKGAGVLWRFTDVDDADIGNVFAAPTIAKFKVNVVKGIPEYRYFAVVSNGLNNYVNDGDRKFNASAPGILFLLSLDKPKADKWTLGGNYFKFSLAAVDKKTANGLSEATAILAGDGAVSYVYAGDLQGNVWRFDFNGLAPWPKALGSTSAKPVFTAIDDSGNRQPITQRPNVVYSPGGYVVLFGTGKFLEMSDLVAKKFRTQTFYGFLDSPAEPAQTIIRSQLMKRTLTNKSFGDSGALAINGSDFKYGLAGTGIKGWYFDFIDSDHTGERSIRTAQVSDNNVYFTTTIPKSDACQAAAHRSYVVNTLSGLPTNSNSNGYLSGASMVSTPMLLPIVPAEIGERDATGKRKVRKRTAELDTKSAATKTGGTPQAGSVIEQVTTAGRLSWREIINWGEQRTVNHK